MVVHIYETLRYQTWTAIIQRQQGHSVCDLLCSFHLLTNVLVSLLPLHVPHLAVVTPHRRCPWTRKGRIPSPGSKKVCHMMICHSLQRQFIPLNDHLTAMCPIRPRLLRLMHRRTIHPHWDDMPAFQLPGQVKLLASRRTTTMRLSAVSRLL